MISIFTEPSANSFINFTNQADAFGFTIAADTDMSIATNKVGGIVEIQAPQLLLQGTTGDINLTSTAGDVNIISNGAGKSIDLTAVSSIALTATGDNLVLRGGTLAQLEATGTGASVVIKPAGDLVFEGTNIESASIGSYSNHNLRIKLNGVYYKIQLYDDTS